MRQWSVSYHKIGIEGRITVLLERTRESQFPTDCSRGSRQALAVRVTEERLMSSSSCLPSTLVRWSSAQNYPPFLPPIWVQPETLQPNPLAMLCTSQVMLAILLTIPQVLHETLLSPGVNILHSWGELFPNVMRDSRHIFADFSLKLCVICAIWGRARIVFSVFASLLAAAIIQ